MTILTPWEDYIIFLLHVNQISQGNSCGRSSQSQVTAAFNQAIVKSSPGSAK